MDKTQFEKDILSLSDPLFRLANSILRNADEASDALQELDLKLWEKRNELSNIENLHGFVFRSMRNLCLDKLRQKKFDTEPVEEQEYDAPNPYQQIEQKDMGIRVRQMIDNLPELQRTIMRMRDVEDMEIAEIADITSLTESAVYTNLSRARQKIRLQLLNDRKKVEEKRWK